LIEIKQLTKRYGERIALNGLDVKLMNGKIYGLLGPNGAGKSTTMNMMTGCLKPTSGSVRINGFDIVEQPLEAKRFIGYLPEQPPLYPDMTPEEYLTFVAEVKGVAPERVMRQVNEVMEMTNITDRKDTLIRHLSKGYGQRVGIAQAMLGNPDIIILDEPTVGLDPKQIIEIRDLIRMLGQSRTVILSSHILAEISAVCDRVLIISHGKLVADDTIEHLENSVQNANRLRLSVRGNAEAISEVLSGIEGILDCKQLSEEDGVISLSLNVSKERDLRDDIFFAMAEHRIPVLTMDVEELDLEDIFLTLTDGEQSEEAEEESDDDSDPSEENEKEEHDA
jgi:ABC-2 type transport system ATP-binding protein